MPAFGLKKKKKESTCKVRDLGLTPGSGGSLEEGNGNPLQYSCLENSMDRGAWQATAHGVAKSHTRLNDLMSSLSACSAFYFFGYAPWLLGS